MGSRIVSYMGVLFFICAYLSVSISGHLGSMNMPFTGSGSAAVDEAATAPVGTPVSFTTERRHTASKQTPEPVLHWVRVTPIQPRMDTFGLAVGRDPGVTASSHHTPSSPRAPPRV
jgi:hypothetical protein